MIERYVVGALIGYRCSGVFQPTTNVMVLNFFLKTSAVVITYRITDQNSKHCGHWALCCVHLMFTFEVNTLLCFLVSAVSIIECAQTYAPVIQLGNMYVAFVIIIQGAASCD